ncbi:MAG: hypothetical protein DME33_07485 [Verrucomicrobia bacterium]|nr:MAG: hypothetical protein DME33_07485 [Verrucomicrobiota bacterium]
MQRDIERILLDESAIRRRLNAREKLETAKPRSLRVCVLLSKKKPRDRHMLAEYVGFEIEDEFVVGYGLDFMERHRNLPLHRCAEKGIVEARHREPSGVAAT